MCGGVALKLLTLGTLPEPLHNTEYTSTTDMAGMQAAPGALKNLLEISKDPEVTLKTNLIDKLRSEITTDIDAPTAQHILLLCCAALYNLREDPNSVTALAEKVVEYLSFDQIQAIEPSIDLLAGIKAPSPPINNLALTVISKAGRSGHAQKIAEEQELVLELVDLWLTNHNTYITEKAVDALFELLDADPLTYAACVENTNNSPNMGKTIFQNAQIYDWLYASCSLSDVGNRGHLSKRVKSVAQGRLMDFIYRLGCRNFDMVSKTHIHAVESNYQSSSLLEFAFQMVDNEDDLLTMTHIQFLTRLLTIDFPGLGFSIGDNSTSSTFSSRSLDAIVQSGLHEKLIHHYVGIESSHPPSSSFIIGSVKRYVAQYALLYPNHFLQLPQVMLDGILSRISQALAIPSVQWAHGNVPSDDLHVLSCLPRVLLLNARSSPLMKLPIKPVNKEVLHALGRIFHGPDVPSDDKNYSPRPGCQTSYRAETAAARVLYLYYINYHHDLWINIVEVADVLAMQDTALAAIAFIRTVIEANWDVIASAAELGELYGSRFPLPLESEVVQLGPSRTGVLPSSGVWALLIPPALTAVLPYLLKPPQTYAHYVAGGAADTENSVWRVATAKFDALVALQKALHHLPPGQLEGLGDVVQTVNRRVASGPMGPQIQLGGHVEAVEL